MTESLKEAQLRRMGLTASAATPDPDAELDKVLTVTLGADSVSPEAREKLRALLKHYAQEANPFRACVRDNIQRFGPGRTEQVCATLKDIIRSTTQWRSVEASDAPDAYTLTDDERKEILTALTDEDYVALEEAITSV